MKKVAMALENPTLSEFSDGPVMGSAAPGDAAEGRRSGGGTGAGVAGAGTGGSGSGSGSGADDGADAGKKHYLERNFGYIRDLIVKNLKYPYAARRMGWKGSVTVAFVILENGNAEAIRVTRSSGYDLLDQSVLKTVRALQPFPRPPARAELDHPDCIPAGINANLCTERGESRLIDAEHERSLTKMDVSPDLAEWPGARYYPLTNCGWSEHPTDMVQEASGAPG